LRAAPDVVVDAAGPFHAYDADCYRLARFCIAAFVAGIATFPGEGHRAHRPFGVSSVSAISSCAVAQLSKDLTAILLIETTILPDAGSPLGAACGFGIGTDRITAQALARRRLAPIRWLGRTEASNLGPRLHARGQEL
jgi:hypothetical protein